MNIIENLFSILNKSPVITISCDQLFGSYKKPYKKRYSLASLGLGSRKIYFLTYCKKFKFVEVVDINDVMPWPSQRMIDSKVKEYKKELNKISNEEVIWQKEFLENRIQDQNDSDSTLQNKVTTFTAINVVIIPVIIYASVNNLEIYQNWVLILLLVSIVYNVLNQIVFLCKTYNIKGRVRPRFSDLKKNSSVKKLALLYYTHWASAREEVRCIAGYIKNTEKYLLYTMLSSAVLFIFLTINTAPYQAVIPSSFLSPITEVSIVNSQGDINPKNLDSFLSLLKSGVSHKNKNFYIISNIPESSSAYKDIQTILETFVENDKLVKLQMKTLDNSKPTLIIKTDGL